MSMTRKFKKQSLKRKTRGSKCRNSHRTKYARKSRRTRNRLRKTRNRLRKTRNRLRKTRNRFSGGAGPEPDATAPEKPSKTKCAKECWHCGLLDTGINTATQKFNEGHAYITKQVAELASNAQKAENDTITHTEADAGNAEAKARKKASADAANLLASAKSKFGGFKNKHCRVCRHKL